MKVCRASHRGKSEAGKPSEKELRANTWTPSFENSNSAFQGKRGYGYLGKKITIYSLSAIVKERGQVHLVMKTLRAIHSPTNKKRNLFPALPVVRNPTMGPEGSFGGPANGQSRAFSLLTSFLQFIKRIRFQPMTSGGMLRKVLEFHSSDEVSVCPLMTSYVT